MGIKNINKVLKKFSNVFREDNISSFKGEVIAIDVSLYMYKYLCLGGNSYLNSMISLILMFKRNEIEPLFVFDGIPPKEKEEERRIRKEARQKIRDRADFLYECLDLIRDYENDIDLDVDRAQRCVEGCQNVVIKGESLGVKDIYDMVNKKYQIGVQYDKLNRQSIIIQKKHFDQLKDLIVLCGCKYTTSPGEAEMYAVWLCKNNKVKAVLTEDTDVMGYKCPIFISKINISTGRCIVITYSDMLKEIELNEKEFLDFCIMCGCDYNKNIPRIGSIKAFKLIKEYKSIENVAKECKKDITILNHIRVRELFNQDIQSEAQIIEGDIDVKKLEELLFKNNVLYRKEEILRECDTIVFKD